MMNNTQSTDRHTCTSSDPWSPEKNKRAEHPDARTVKQVDGWPAGDIVVSKCPNCGLTFEEELPQ